MHGPSTVDKFVQGPLQIQVGKKKYSQRLTVHGPPQIEVNSNFEFLLGMEFNNG